ncbi:F-box protein At5g50450 [Musa acuminata AAA Group]|uniref:F-box protein At5g50450 n=1 Tax=Musa acuminata AAA Group TaxID=214697 RepID=UPI0031DC8D38
MNTRRASQCLRPPTQINDHAACRKPCKRRRGPPTLSQGLEPCARKRPWSSAVPAPAATEEESVDYFDGLPDDIVVSVLSELSSSADRPSDLISALLTCKRFHVLGHRPLVLSKAGASCIAVRAKSWCDSAHRFLKRCVDCGNLEASYVLGMIRFYALENRGSGAALMARAAIGSHAAALYSLAIIQFNGSGGSKTDKDLRAGAALCARAAFLGHVDALREIGHCLQDGYGVRRNVTEGRRFLIQANARELAAAVSSWPAWQEQRRQATAAAGITLPGCCPLLSDYGWSLPAPEPHPANQFLAEWFGASAGAAGEGLRLCSHRGCGRPETRRHEFRRCSVCGLVNYCSRACQALDWKLSHKAKCNPTDGWAAVEGGAATH